MMSGAANEVGDGSSQLASDENALADLAQLSDFEAGRIFERYDKDKQGRIGKEEFHQLMTDYKLRVGESAAAMEDNLLPEDGDVAGHPFTWDCSNGAGAGPSSFQLWQGGIQAKNTSARALASTAGPRRVQRQELCGEAWSDAVVSTRGLIGTGISPGLSLEDAYRQRVAVLQRLLRGSLCGKKERLLQQMMEVQNCMEIVQKAKLEIEQETLADSEAVLHRLRTTEAAKMKALRDQLTEMQHDLEGFERFARMSTGSADGLAVGAWPSEPPCASETDMRSLVEQYPQMCAFAERLRLREFESLQHFISPQVSGFPVIEVIHIHTNTDLYLSHSTLGTQPPQVFESEVRTRQQVAQQSESASQLLKVKDEMIFTLLHEREAMKKEQEELRSRHTTLEGQMEQLNKASVEEIEEWVRLTDRMKQQVEQLKAQLATK
jgi:hypothetical protein